jgi:NADPH2:quinone reductase
MQAIRVEEPGGPEVLVLADVPELEPGEGEILVQVKAAGVNPVDFYIRSGTYAIKPQCPYTPGMDGAGVVQKVGAGVTKFSGGERVYIAGSKSGTYAQQALCSQDQVFALPDHVLFEQGAAVYVAYATAYRALFQKAKLQEGETVLIHGASGGVGIACVQWALARGLTVVATAGSERGIEFLEEMGVKYVINHHDVGAASDILGATCGRGVDGIIEMLANVNLATDLTLLATGGRIVIVGSRGPIEINPRDIMAREAVVTGLVLMNAPSDEAREIHDAIATGLGNRTLDPLVGTALPLSEAARAHEQVMQGNSFGKIVLLTEA